MKSHEINPFVKHPFREGIWVSRCGSVLDAKNRIICTPYLNDGWGYHSVNVDGEKHCIHILVCETFHGKMPKENMIGNHIDGDKSNNHADNLEWATKSENLIHAYETGLRSDNRPVFIRNVSTGEETEFYSLQRTAEHFKCNGEKVYRWLRSKNRVPFEGNYDMRYTDTNYKGLTVEDINITANGAPKRILLIDKDGNYSTYGSLGLAVEEVGCSRETLGRQLRGATRRKPTGEKGYLGYYLEEYAGELPDDISDTPFIPGEKVIPVRKPVPIEVTSLNDGEVTRYESCEEFAEAIGYTKSAVQKATRLKSWWVRLPGDAESRPVNIRYIRDEQIVQVSTRRAV